MAGSRCHVSGRELVRPYGRGREGYDNGREMCEVDEEDAFDRMMRPFNPDVEESDEGDAIAESHEETEEEGLIPKIKKVVVKPTQEEVERHMVTHIPFREWCPHCVMGKSKTDPHLKRSRDERIVPKLSLDYMYMTTGKQEEQMGMPILVG